ncbi:hypothetical protein EXIGLDRAFT_85025 [Exidia glandulosa HHB12029]|uniref:Uncharacterized protein n=1 Tax=Exidia glandulosa HHB12029 TaxID=1314781 RepID=A0A165HGR1_EXIGL|nr:hypothetical protein EXIGLDRAFT_85025 [Exidia glandulosa HHB12029]
MFTLKPHPLPGARSLVTATTDIQAGSRASRSVGVSVALLDNQKGKRCDHCLRRARVVRLAPLLALLYVLLLRHPMQVTCLSSMLSLDASFEARTRTGQRVATKSSVSRSTRLSRVLRSSVWILRAAQTLSS